MASLSLTDIANISTTITNKKGDRQQPCIVPLAGENQAVLDPLLVTHASAPSYITFIHFRKSLPNPNSSKASIIHSEDTESKALWKSKARSHDVSSSWALYSIISSVRRILVTINLPLTKTRLICITNIFQLIL